MKKNIAMRLASGLMLSCLLSTCVISGTFAKYTTTANNQDTARVAKWGVTISATGETFAQEYETDDGAYTETNSVVSTETTVVAPGTDGNMFSVVITGAPEVAVNVSYVADLTLTGWKLADTTEYCPIVITVNGTPISCTGTLAEFEAAVESAIAAYSKDYAANTTLSTVAVPVVSWSWAIETGADAAEKAANNVKDTYLGDQAAAGNASTIALKVTTTVTQID